MKKSSKQLFTIAASCFILFLLTGCGGGEEKKPEDYAAEWCALNRKIEKATGDEKQLLIAEAEQLEISISKLYANDDDAMQIIITQTDECD